MRCSKLCTCLSGAAIPPEFSSGDRVAKEAGTSIAMIERYYTKYVDDADVRLKLNAIVAF